MCLSYLPFAEKLVSEVCENCGRAIGKMETPQIIDGHIVCIDCTGRIKASRPAPLDYGQKPQSPPDPITIEQTSKQWKFVQLAGVVVMLIGGAVIFGGTAKSILAFQAVGVLLVITGLSVLVAGVAAAWWHHG